MSNMPLHLLNASGLARLVREKLIEGYGCVQSEHVYEVADDELIRAEYDCADAALQELQRRAETR